MSASIDGVIDSAARASIDGVIDSACGMTPSNHLSCVGVHRWDLERSAGWKYSKLHLSCIAMHSYLAVFACWFLLVCQWAETTMTILGQDVGIHNFIFEFIVWIHGSKLRLEFIYAFMKSYLWIRNHMNSNPWIHYWNSEFKTLSIQWIHISELGSIRIHIHQFNPWI